MQILPQFEIKPLRDCTGGELVRPLIYGSQGTFSLVASVKDKPGRALVYLGNDAVQYDLYSDDHDISVLSYGTSCELHIPTDSPAEFQPNRMCNGNGCIVKSARGCVMNVRRDFGHHQWQTGQYDIELGELRETDSNINDIVSFGQWNLYLRADDIEPGHKILIAAYAWRDPYRQAAAS